MPPTFAAQTLCIVFAAAIVTGADAALAFAATAIYPAECIAYDGSSLTGIHLWDERQPEIVARSIAWIERTM